MAPAYLAADCHAVGLRRRSSSAAFCHIKDVRCWDWTYNNYRLGCFATADAVPKLWNTGIAFQLHCDKLTLAFNDLSGY